MATTSFLRWIAGWAAAGLAIAVGMLALLFWSPSSWHIETLLVALCPPSALIILAESCPNWLSQCFIQPIVLVVLLNGLLYTTVGAPLWVIAKLFSLGSSSRNGA
jgi:hypothetical protein